MEYIWLVPVLPWDDLADAFIMPDSNGDPDLGMEKYPKMSEVDYMANLRFLLGDLGGGPLIQCKNENGMEVFLVKDRIMHLEQETERVKIVCDGGKVYYYP